MRDGRRLYTAVYAPKGKPGKFPMLLERTPYGCHPYGPSVPNIGRGIGRLLDDAGTIVVQQDVRGRFMSEGKFVEIRPQLQVTLRPEDIDESTDAYDTIEFLVKNVPNNNGRVGATGISYPGFYAATTGLSRHPALKCISPQAPVAEWFLGDDVHHNGAFFLMDNFDFYFWFGYDQDVPSAQHPQIESFGPRPDAYRFFLDLGNAAEADKRYFKGRFPFWNDVMRHDAMDEFWQSRSLPSQMKGLKCAVLTVGGWFDAEDLYGALNVYQQTERRSPGIENRLVMGPWSHGQWAGGNANTLGPIRFSEASLGAKFRDEIEAPFFLHHLHGQPAPKTAEATMFETGANRWRSFGAWPPPGRRPGTWFLSADGTVTGTAGVPGRVTYVSDPANPVPFQPGTFSGRRSDYMVADQRFLAGRDDVKTWRSPVLTMPLTVAGPLDVMLKVKTDATDLDLIVKVLDEQPANAPANPGAQLMVRGDVMRAKFRWSWQNPRPLTPGAVEAVPFRLNDVLHTFLPGHRVVIQVQSSWFPLVDRNPQTFTNIYTAPPEAYRKATVEILAGPDGSRVNFGSLPASPAR